MMLSLRIATRFLRTGGSQTVLIAVGIAVGLAVLIFIGSLIASLQAFLIEQTLGSSSHITLKAEEEGDPVDFSAADFASAERDARITTVLGVRETSTIFTKDRKSVPLIIKSGDPVGLDGIYGLEDRLTAGEYDLGLRRVLIGKEFATDFELVPGDTFKVTVPSGSAISMRVAGIFDLGSAQVNAGLILTDDDFARREFGFGRDEYSSIETQISDVFDSTDVTAGLSRRFRDLTIDDWQVTRADLLSALAAQSSSTYMIQFFVVLAVGLGIASTLSVSAIQKTRQIGILKALGLSDLGSATVFLWQGLLLGTAGTALGVGAGVGLIALFQGLTAGTGSFPIVLQPSLVVVSAIVGLSVSMLSAVFPSRRTSRLDPIEVIQGG